MAVFAHPRRLVVATVAGLALTSALGACSSADGDDAGSDGATKIGLIAAEQGPFAFAGTSYLKGAELAAEQLQEDGVEIELVVEEGSEDPAKSITAFNKLVGQEDVAEVVCCISSAVAGAMKPLATQREVPLVVYGATTPGLEDPPYVYRPALLPQQGIAPVATELAEALEPASAVHVTASDNDGLVAQSQAAAEALGAAGVKDLGTVNTLVADTDFSGAVTEILSTKAEMVTIYTLGEAAANIVKSLRERGYDGVILANNAIATGPNLASFGKTLADTYYSVEYFPTSELEMAADFTEAYEATYDETPDLFSSQGYTAVMYAAAGVSGSDGDVDAESISAALGEISTFDSVWGELTFEDGQSNSSSFQVVQIDDSGAPQLWSND
ncbi:ABC-type branched-subunit amino acid transport system substrate-binding protein [Nocardioides marinisabuli]|uniref:ABC-type branched-subunit amino acid transport system substrate-binding protein n=1 Tax=Nocardioides marinisabuli TaxID=419476 RepID=A0A7Y9JSN2_9ACTN|nr:ABC transporter substrate-binding protein [Nocardioides marinisabuli]NYD59526.1 ABC-type branched-subunit amino acid transport system substrate-binding protein [Nocardioides marinisabuli]